AEQARAEESREQAAAERSRVEELSGRLAEERSEAERAHAESQERIGALEAQLRAAEEAAERARADESQQVADLRGQLEAEQARAEESHREAEAQAALHADELAAAEERAESLREAAEALRAQAAALSEELEATRARTEEALEDARAERERAEALAEECSRAEALAEEARRAALEEQQARVDELAGQLAASEAAAEQRLQEAVEGHRREVEALTGQLDEARREVEQITAEAAERDRAHEAALAERQVRIDELSAELAGAEARVEQVRRELVAEHEERTAELRAELKHMEEAHGRALAEQQAVIGDLQAELTEIGDRLESARRDAEARAEQARAEALAEREAEVAGLREDVRRAEKRAEEIAEEARREYATMLARMSERVSTIERHAAEAMEEKLAARQREIAELREALEDAERRAAEARRLAREEYEQQIARSLAEAAAVDGRLGEARDEAREEFQAEIDRLNEQLADAQRRIEEAGLIAATGAADLTGQGLQLLEEQGGDERRRLAESLSFLRALLDGIPYPVFFTDAAGRYQSCNAAFARNVLGLPRSEIIDCSPDDLQDRVPTDLLEELSRNDRRVGEDGQVVSWEARVGGPDGGTRSWAFRKEPLVDGGEVVGIIGAMMDISGLEAAQRALEQERLNSATVLQRAPAVIAEIRPDGTVSSVYGAVEEVLGWAPDELVGSNWWRMLFPDELGAPIRDVLGAMRSGGDLEDRALRLRTKAGEERVLSWSTSNVRTAERELLSILMVGYDITARALREETLENHFQETVERVKKYRCLSNTLRLTQDENLSLVEVLSGIVASIPEAWRHPGITTARGCVWGRERSFGESPYRPVASMSSDVLVDGEVVGEIEVSYHEQRPEMSEGPFTLEERELLDTIARHLGEMIERRSAEESLAKLRAFRHTLIDQANLWLMAIDRDRNVVLWNRAAERISGYARNEVIGNDRVWEMLFPEPEYRAEVITRMTEITFGADAAEDWETVLRSKSGAERVVSWHAHRLIDDDGTTLGAVALGRDITDHRAAASST
ncbi:MAG: PAS domain S-box protein, partial [Armatimonadota bacterium]